MSTRGPWDLTPERAARVDAPTTTAGSAGIQHAPSAWLTYEPFYGLREPPFSISSNPAFFHQGRSHASTFQALLGGIRRRERLSVLTGDIGTGKTTLCRAVLENLDRETFSAFVADPFASREDLLKVLLMEFGVMSLADLTSGRLRTSSRTELSYLLYDFLGKLAPLQAFAVVIIDEAQNLSLPLLEELRILSDFDGRDRQLQVVLVGQLELRHKLKLAEMRQVDQRVSVRCHLEPLSGDGVAEYIAHRLRVAGGSPDRVGFSAEACAAIYQGSNGVPRVINRICDRALHQGHVKRAAVIDRNIVQGVLRELEDGAPAIARAFMTGADAAVTGAAHEEPAAPRGGAVAARAAPEAGPAMEPPRRASAAVQHPGSISLPRAAGKHDRRRNATYLQQLTQSWRRVAVLIALLAGAVTLGVPALESVRADVAQPSPLPALPEHVRLATPLPLVAPTRSETLPPQLSAAGSYTIEMALFETRQAATWLAEDLAAAGFRAYREQLDLPYRGIQHLVAIGPYATRARAEWDLQRLHTAPGYEGARLRGN
jgi:general secretion pathway protein A